MRRDEVEERNLCLVCHWVASFFSETNRRNFAGLPATMTFAGTSFVTTLPAPTIALSPMVTLLKIVDPEPIDAPLRTIVFSTFQSASVLRSPSTVVARG